MKARVGGRGILKLDTGAHEVCFTPGHLAVVHTEITYNPSGRFCPNF